MLCGLGASSQANRLRASCLQRQRGRGGRPEDSRSSAALSSLFALQWFSHQTQPIKSKPPFDKDRQLCLDEMPPTLQLSYPPFFLSFSAPFCLAPSVFSLFIRLTSFSKSRSNGKTLCCISDLLRVSVQLSLGLSEERRKDL